MPTPEAAEETRKFIKKAGGDATWDRLAEYLEKESSGKETFVINRTFDAPLDVMFEMWTNPEALLAVAAADRIRDGVHPADIRPGGSTFYFMTNNGDVKMYGRAEYLEIEKPDRLVYTQQFCDENENISRHPMAPTWPETMLTTVTADRRRPGPTRVTVTWEPYGADDARRTRNLHQGRGRHDPRLDRLVRQAGSAAGKPLNGYARQPPDPPGVLFDFHLPLREGPGEGFEVTSQTEIPLAARPPSNRSPSSRSIASIHPR